METNISGVLASSFSFFLSGFFGGGGGGGGQIRGFLKFLFECGCFLKRQKRK